MVAAAQAATGAAAAAAGLGRSRAAAGGRAAGGATLPKVGDAAAERAAPGVAAVAELAMVPTQFPVLPGLAGPHTRGALRALLQRATTVTGADPQQHAPTLDRSWGKTHGNFTLSHSPAAGQATASMFAARCDLAFGLDRSAPSFD